MMDNAITIKTRVENNAAETLARREIRAVKKTVRGNAMRSILLVMSQTVKIQIATCEIKISWLPLSAIC